MGSPGGNKSVAQSLFYALAWMLKVKNSLCNAGNCLQLLGALGILVTAVDGHVTSICSFSPMLMRRMSFLVLIVQRTCLSGSPKRSTSGFKPVLNLGSQGKDFARYPNRKAYAVSATASRHPSSSSRTPPQVIARLLPNLTAKSWLSRHIPTASHH
jgi:hypothetical protein